MNDPCGVRVLFPGEAVLFLCVGGWLLTELRRDIVVELRRGCPAKVQQ